MFSFKIAKFQKMQRFWVFSYFSSTRIKAVPIVSIDFSAANLGGESRLNLHWADSRLSWNYQEIARKILKEIRFFSTENIVPFMFGCKLEEDGETLDWCPMSNDERHLQVLSSEFWKCYCNWLKFARLASPVNHSTVFSKLNLMSEFDQLEGLNNFFLSLHFWTGKIDDLSKLENELSMLNDKPVSVIVIVLKWGGLNIQNDFKNLDTTFAKMQQRTRKFISFIEIDLNCSKAKLKLWVQEIVWEIINHFESFIDRFRFEIDKEDHKSIELESNLTRLSELKYFNISHRSIFEEIAK